MLDSMLNSLVKDWELGIGNWEDSIHSRYSLVAQSPDQLGTNPPAQTLPLLSLSELEGNFRREGLGQTILTSLPSSLKGLTFPEG